MMLHAMQVKQNWQATSWRDEYGETLADAVRESSPQAGFDPARRYPVVVYTYGGPNAQVVLDARPSTSGRFNHWLATRGFVVFALDNRGSSARGRAFEGAVDRALGSSQLPDQLAGVRWLGEQPWVDPDRIGIWGWSYGGYMTIYALTHAPESFAAGVAVAPVTDWRLYDSIYTERYMGTPDENPEGYAMGSVLGSVANLVDPLLVIHGTGDDNVHVQHTLQLADRAWRAGVRFDLMLFPNLTHGIHAPGSHLQVFGAIADYFERHLAPDPRPPDVRY
jgi:dipeptidyl-peptidase-4